jgi:hypothetical protein
MVPESSCGLLACDIVCALKDGIFIPVFLAILFVCDCLSRTLSRLLIFSEPVVTYTISALASAQVQICREAAPLEVNLNPGCWCVAQNETGKYMKRVVCPTSISLKSGRAQIPHPQLSAGL